MCTHPIGQGGWKPIWPLMNCQIPKNHGPLRLVVTPNPPFFAQEILGGRSNSFGASWIRRNIVLGAQRSEKHLQWVRYNNIYINIPNIYWLGINFDKLLSWKSRNLLVFFGGEGIRRKHRPFWVICCYSLGPAGSLVGRVLQVAGNAFLPAIFSSFLQWTPCFHMTKNPDGSHLKESNLVCLRMIESSNQCCIQMTTMKQPGMI